MILQIQTHMSKENIEQLFITAIDKCGAGWFAISKESEDAMLTEVMDADEKSMGTMIFDAVTFENMEVKIVDNDDRSKVIGILSKTTMEERMQTCVDECPYEARCAIEGVATLEMADIVLQYLCFGKIIFNTKTN